MAKPLLQYNEAIAAEGGTSTNRQTGAITTAPVVPVAPLAPTVATPPSTTAIPMDQLGGSSQALKLPGVSTETSQADGMVAGAEATTKSIEQRMKEATPAETESSRQAKALFGDINALLPGMANKSTDQLAAEKEQGLPQLQKQLGDLNAQIMSRFAEYNQQSTNAELAPGETPLAIVRGRQAVIQRNQASDIGLLQARALGLQGQVQVAQDTADRAIDLKYDTLEDTINVKTKQLELLEPTLTREESRFAAALKQKYDEEQVLLKEEREDAKANVALAFSANIQTKYTNKGGKWFRTSDGKPMNDKDKFFAEAGVSSFEEAYQKGLVTDMTAAKLADLDFVQKLRETYFDAGINFTDDAQAAVDKLGGSNKYQKEQYVDNTPKIEDFNGQPYVFNNESGLFEPVAVEQTLDVNGNPVGPRKPLSAEASKVLANTDSGLAAIREMTNILTESGASVFIPNPLNQTRQQYFTSADNLVDIIGRMRSGGAITESEEARFKSLLPTALNSEKTWKNKLTQLQTLLENVKTNISVGGGSESTNPKAVSQTGSRTLASVVTVKYPTGATGGQCGDFARQVITGTGRTYPPLGNGLNSKVAAVQKYGVPATQANTGDVVVTRENPTYGHVAVVLQRTPQGVIVSESNFKQSNKISNGRLIPYNQIVGAIKPTMT